MKQRRRTKGEYVDDWREIRLDVPRGPSLFSRRKKLRLYADHNFPRAISYELHAYGVPVLRAADDGRASHDDHAVFGRARELGRVLLTLDADFWDDGRHRLRESPGLIYVAIPSTDPDAIVEALAQFYVLFAEHWPLDDWPGMKARITRAGFVLKTTIFDGRVGEYEIRPSRRRVFLREIRGGE